MGEKAITDNRQSSGHEISYTSELRKLSSDPTITRHPDPKLQLRFLDPDELGEEQPIELVINSLTPPRRVYPAYTDRQLRRSPKE